MSEENAPVLVEIEQGVARLKLNRPKVLNALDIALADGLLTGLAKIQQDPSVRVIVISGEGRGFLAGGDLLTFKNAGEGAPEVASALLRVINSFLKQLHDLPIPVIASVHGPVAGAGMSLALACDLVIASEDARFNMAYARIGASPDVGVTWTLPRIVGLRKAMELTLLCDNLSAAEALALGMVNKVVPTVDLPAETIALARRIAAGAPRALGESKRLLNSAFGRGFGEQLDEELTGFARCAGTADFREGLAAFFEKRGADFKGE